MQKDKKFGQMLNMSQHVPVLLFQAAARHQCSYLVNLHVNDFLQVGGDPKWLNGLDGAPQKLRALGELNKVLAHRPWLLTKTHIEVFQHQDRTASHERVGSRSISDKTCSHVLNDLFISNHF